MVEQVIKLDERAEKGEIKRIMERYSEDIGVTDQSIEYCCTVVVIRYETLDGIQLYRVEQNSDKSRDYFSISIDKLKKLNYIPTPCTKGDIDKVLDTLLKVDISNVEKGEYREFVDFLDFLKKVLSSKFDPSQKFNGYIDKANKRIESYNNRIG